MAAHKMAVLVLLFASVAAAAVKKEYAYSPLNITEIHEQEVLTGIEQSCLIKASRQENPSLSSAPLFDLPFMDRLDYLEALGRYVSKIDPYPFVLIIVAPKSAGKSRGLSIMKKAWKGSPNYTVFDLKFFQFANPASNEQSVAYFLDQLIHYYWSLSNSDQECIALSYARVCNKSASVPVKERASSYYSSIKTWIVAMVSTACLGWITHLGLKRLWELLRDLWSGLNCWNLLVVLVLIIAACCTPRILASIAAYFYIPDIAILMKTDSWADPLCVVSTIFPCTSQRPVVLISEFTGLSDDAQHHLMVQLKRAKDEPFVFPIIIETSDFNWIYSDAVIKKGDSFMARTVDELTLKECQKYLSEVYDIFNKEEVSIIFDSIGGHVGLISQVWLQFQEGMASTRNRSYNLNTSIDAVVARQLEIANFALQECQKEKGHNLCEELLLLVLANDPRYRNVKFSEPIKIFLQHNVLFCNAHRGRLIPQNRALADGLQLLIKGFSIE